MRGMFSIVSLLAVVAIAAYFYTSQPELGQSATGEGQYQKLQSKAVNAAAMLQSHNNAQAEVDAASGAPPAPATNAPPSSN